MDLFQLPFLALLPRGQLEGDLGQLQLIVILHLPPIHDRVGVRVRFRVWVRTMF